MNRNYERSEILRGAGAKVGLSVAALLSGLIACSIPARVALAKGPAKKAAAKLSPPRAGEKVFIGKLLANRARDKTLPGQYCLEDGKLWRGAPYRVGRINVFPGDGEVPGSLAGAAVAVYGKVGVSLDARLKKIGPCPERKRPAEQFRSDWLSDEGGFRTTHKKLARIPYITARKIVRLDMLRLPPATRSRGKYKPGRKPAKRLQLEISVFNPTSRPLKDLLLLLHYEGGPTKTMGHYVQRWLSIPPGAWKVIKVPATLVREWRKGEHATWGFHTAHVLGEHGKHRFMGSALFKLDPAWLARPKK